MAAANIVIYQAANPTPAGTAGRARDDLLAGSVCILSNQSNAGVYRHRWELLDRPEGSSAGIFNPGSPTPTITPDVPGTYRVRLTVNTGKRGPDGSDGEVQIRSLIVRDAAGFRPPAIRERVEESNFSIGGGFLNEAGDLHEFRRRMKASDNRADGVQYNIAGGGQQAFDIDWPLPDAHLVYLEVTTLASTDTDIEITADAAYTHGLLLSTVDATSGYIVRSPTLITRPSGAGLEGGKIYFRFTNNDGAADDYDIRWRIQAL